MYRLITGFVIITFSVLSAREWVEVRSSRPAEPVFNLETQYPFTKAFRGFLFYDRGNVYGTGTSTTTTAENFDLGKMRHSLGAGVRFISPFGPLGFSYGFKLDKQNGERAAEFHFSAGSAF